jgi:hypothetical protein
MPPSVICSRAARHAGHAVVEGSGDLFAIRLPHFGQNAEPANMSAKQSGQLIAAKRARQ